ncbi:MAG: hypothetical protein JWN86_3201 [Planctomycetota bacterium]|nr:hypothetical protein [Planctomycetota bacterium]
MTPATPTDTAELGSLREEQARLRAWLAGLRRTLRFQMALEFALDATAGAVLAGAVLVTLDATFRLGLSARQILLGVSLIGITSALVIRTIPRLRAVQLDDLSLAMTLDRVRPGTGQHVADVLQLPDQIDEARPSASPALVRLAVLRAADALKAADWEAHWNWDRTAGRSLALVGALLVPIAFALVAPNPARLSFARWLQGSNERWPQKTYLSVAGLGGGNRMLAPRDELFAIEVHADLSALQPRKSGWSLTGRGEPFAIRNRPKVPTAPKTVRLRERAADGSVRDAVMTAIAPGRYRHELPPSSASSTFELVGGDDWLGPIRVDRVDRPSLAALKLRVRDAGSATGAFRAIEDSGQSLIFLPDTEVEITLVGSEPIALTRVDMSPGASPGLGRVDPRTFSGRWTLREATTLEIQLTSEGTGLASKPTFLSLGLLKDREPRVALRAQGVGAHVTPVATIPLTLAATDDLGLASLRLQFERTAQAEGKAEPTSTRQAIAMPLAADGGRAVLDHQARHDVDLQVAPPAIGTILRFQAEAEDRCARGPQVGRSGVVQMQVVSPDELFYEILIRQRAERAKFLAAVESAETQTPILATTASAEDYLKVSRSLHSGTRQLDQIAARIADSLVEMKLNQVGSPKSHRLLQEGVIDPIRALNSGPGTELRSVLQALGGGAGPGDAEKARRLHGEVVARMKVILDQMSQWESFVDVVNQIAEVIKIQQKVLKSTQDARESRTKEVFDDNKP